MDGKGVTACIASNQDFYWDGGRVYPDIPLSNDHTKFMRDMDVDTGDKCFSKTKDMIHDQKCQDHKEAYCTIDIGPDGHQKNLGMNILFCDPKKL